MADVALVRAFCRLLYDRTWWQCSKTIKASRLEVARSMVEQYSVPLPRPSHPGFESAARAAMQAVVRITE